MGAVRVGVRFGRLEVEAPIKSRAGYWLCRCDCGVRVALHVGKLTGSKKNRRRSCGCARPNHRRSPLLFGPDGRPILDERFWSKVQKTDTCWHWTRARDTKGYGLFGVGGSGRTRNVHVLSFWASYGAIPDGVEVRHACDNKACVRPDHLELGTHAQNMRDAQQRGRSCRGTRQARARLNDVAVLVIRHLVAAGVHPTRIADAYGIPRTNVDTIARGETWRHVGGPIRPYRWRKAA